MQEILQDDIKNALVVCLREHFPNAKFYKDGEVRSYPSFYVSFTNIFLKPISLKYSDIYTMEFYIKIEYREALEPSSVVGLNTRMDVVGMKMLDCLRKINLYDKYYFLDITNNETIDSVRIFEGNFKINVTYELQEHIRMRKLEMKGSGLSGLSE